MEYTVLARRYRPQAFGEVVGQEHIAQALKNAINSDRVAHAYLFTGARGVGKTSTARILAKSLNCPQAQDGEPCNTCEVCHSISIGSDVDVIEIDGASNRGIEDIRALRANVNASFDFTTAMFGAKTLAEAAEVSTAHFRAQFEALSAQTKELSALAQKIAADTSEPIKSGVTKSFKFSA